MTAEKKSRRGWLWLAAGLVIVGGAAWLLWPVPWPIGPDTTVATGPLDADGYVNYEAALNERLGDGVKPEENAAVLLVRAVGPRPQGRRMRPRFYKWLGEPEPLLGGDYFAGLEDHLKVRVDASLPYWVDPYFERLVQSLERSWSPADCPQLADWVAANEGALELAVAASRRPKYYYPHVSARPADDRGTLSQTLIPLVQKVRELVSALASRAALRAAAGEPDAAWEDVLACLRLGRIVAKGGTVIENLVGVAVHGIGCRAAVGHVTSADLTEGQIRERMRQLRKLPPAGVHPRTFDLVERFWFLDEMQNVHRGAGGGFLKRRVMAGRDWSPGLRLINEWFDRLTAIARSESRAERAAQWADMQAEIDEWGQSSGSPETAVGLLSDVSRARARVAIGLMASTMGKVLDAADRAGQRHRLTVIAFALEAHRRGHGDYPGRLADMRPALPQGFTDDVFAGGPLKYRRAGDGYSVFSVGPNGRDEAGGGDDIAAPARD